MPIDFDAFDEEIKAGEVALRVDASLKKGAAPEVAPAEEPAEPETPPEAENPEGEEGKKDEAEKLTEEKPKTKTPDRIAKKLARDKQIRNLEIENARLKGVQEGQTKPTAVAKPEDNDPEPNPQTNPLEHTQWQLRQEQARNAKRDEEFEAFKHKATLTEAEKLWAETDKEMAEANPAYSSSMKFLREHLRKALSDAHPEASKQQVEQAAKRAEHEYVGKIAAQGLDIDTYFIGEAVKSGFNPYAEVAKPAADVKAEEKPADVRPKTDPREVALHKKSAGSVATVPQGGGKGPLSASDIGKMDGMSDLWKLQNLDNSDWSRMAREAARKGA